MRKHIRRLRRQPESGMTLVEIMVAAMISAIVFAVFAGVLFSVQTLINRQHERSTNNDQARLASEHLDRHIRSAAGRFDPQRAQGGLVTTTGFDLVALTWSNPNASEPRCAQWEVEDGLLRFRTWPLDDPTSATSWRTIADAVVNEQESLAPFELKEWGRIAARSVQIRLLLNDRLESQPDATIQIDTTVTGRNIQAGSAPVPLPSPPPLPDECSPVPTS